MQFDHEFEVIYPSTTGIDSLTIGGTGSPGALNLPAGTTATRTTAPVAGSTRWNTTLGVQESYNGTAWFSHLPILSQAASTVYIAPSTGAGLPTFRLMSIGELSDVVITSPVAQQVLQYNGANWVNSSVLSGNASGLIGVSNSGGGTAWSLVSGTRYSAQFVHNLGTQNVVITVYNTADNSVVIPDKVVATDANTVTITVVGNTLTLKVVVVANGASIAAGGTSGAIITQYQGVQVNAASTILNFIGASVVSGAGNTTTVSIGARFTNYANSFDTPNNSDWAVNAFAPVVTDPINPAMNTRQFSATVEQGVGFTGSIPAGATQATFRLRGRAATAPGAATTVQFRIYWRAIPNNGPVGAWTAALDLPANTLPTNTNFQYFSQSSPLSVAGLTAGVTYQFEVTRKVIGTYTGNFLLAESTFEFS